MPAGALQRARRLRAVGPTFFRLDYSGYYGYVLLDLTELSSYLPLVSSFEFGNASGKLFPCTEGRVRTRMTSAGAPRAGAFTATPEREAARAGQPKRWPSLVEQSVSQRTEMA